jgi:hypothetical protein
MPILAFGIESWSTTQHHHLLLHYLAAASLAANTLAVAAVDRSEVLTKESGTYRRTWYTELIGI